MKVLKSRPPEWHLQLALSSVPHDGSVYSQETTLAVTLPVSYYGQEYTLTAPLFVQVEAVRGADRVVVSISVKATLEAPCSRCLERAEAEISSTLRWVFATKEEEKEQENEWEYDELVLVANLEEIVSLEDYVWETFITSLPISVLCKPDCRGICPSCGANLNRQNCNCHEDKIDPRLEILKNLL